MWSYHWSGEHVVSHSFYCHTEDIAYAGSQKAGEFG